MLNVVFHGNVFNGTGSPATQYTGDEVRYQAFFYKVGGGSSPSAFSGIRQSILGQYNINLGDGDWLGQTGIIDPADQVVVVFWTPNTQIRTSNSLMEWALTTFTVGALPANNNKVILRDVELRPVQVPNCVASNSLADPILTWNDLGSNDNHSWTFMGNTMEQRDTYLGESMFSGMNVIDYIEIDWGNTAVSTGLTPGGSYQYTYPFNGTFTSEFRAFNEGGLNCFLQQPVTINNAVSTPIVCDFTQVKGGCGYKYTAVASGASGTYDYKWEVFEHGISPPVLLAELDGPSDIFEYNWPKVGTFDVKLTVTCCMSSISCTTTKTFPVTECPIEIRTIIQPGPGGGGASARNSTSGVPYMHYADRYKEVVDEFDKLERRIRAKVHAELVGELIQTEEMNYTQAVHRKSYATITVICLNENPEAMISETSVVVEHTPEVAAQILNKPIFEKLEVSNLDVSIDSSFISVSGKIDPRHELNRYVKIRDYNVTVENISMMGSEMESIEEGKIYIDLLEVYR